MGGALGLGRLSRGWLRFGGFPFCCPNAVEGAQRKETVAAGRATIGWKVRQTEKRRVPILYQVSGHSFDVEIAAHLAVDVTHKGDWDRPRVESYPASDAPPGAQPKRAENAILETMALGTIAAPTMTSRTEQGLLLFLLRDRTEYAMCEVVAR
jgi:hypothetical protein